MKYRAMLAALIFGLTVLPVQASEGVESTGLTAVNQRTNRLRSDSIRGLMGKYFKLKLVPFDKNNNYLIDTVSIAHERIYGDLEQMNDSVAETRDIALDPEFYRLLVPFTYYNSPVARISSVDFDPADSDAYGKGEDLNTLLPSSFESYERHSRIGGVVDNVLLDAYMVYPDKVVFTESELAEVHEYVDNIDAEVKTSRKNTRRMMMDALASDPVAGVEGSAAVELHKPNWWTTKGNFSLQLSQHYVSDNWYNGGESSNSFIATLQLSANYDDKQKVQWENLLDAKLGIASTPSDTVHSMLSNTDMFRIYSKLGIQAAKKWYYTMSLEFKTQFVHGYKSNDPELISGWLAPADLSVALGMDYKEQKEKVNFSVFIAPFTWTMRYVGNDDVDETTYGLDEGQSVKHDFGSEIQPKLEWKIANNITLESRLDYLTSYEWVRIEWENTLNLTLNKYLSTKIYVHARYDDSTTPISGNSRFQLNELLSFGINYNW